MTVLLDTQLLLWSVLEPERLPEPARGFFDGPAAAGVFSAVSIWEVAIKTGLGRPEFHVDPRELRRTLLQHGFAEMSVDGRHAAAVVDLPRIHADHFDRLLIAQAWVEGMTLLTADARLADYGALVRLA